MALFGAWGGGGGGGTSTPTAPPPVTNTPTSPTPAPELGPYTDDGVKRMPVANSAEALASARRKRKQIVERTGRASTRLVPSRGTVSYENSFLGDA